jgi:hypothetical protein
MTRKVFATEKAAHRAGVWFCAAAGAEWAIEKKELPLVRAAAEGSNNLGGWLVTRKTFADSTATARRRMAAFAG